MRRLIGDRAFYKMVLAVTVPIMIQNGITNFVGLLDNIMVGQVGTEPMSGVAIANQLLFVFNICIFGGISGAGIFTAQFFGQGDNEGVRSTFRFKFIICVLLCAGAFGVFLGYGDQLISLYLHEGEDAGDIAATLSYGREYLMIMLVGIIPFALTQAYSGTLRECGRTLLPMLAGVAAVLVNLLFNYILIFGNFGAPRLGVAGAAIATVISRFVELFIVAGVTHIKSDVYPFIKGVYRSLRMPGWLVGQILKKGTPLLVNEVLWSVGMAAMMQCYSVRGLAVVAGLNISSTVSNLFNVVFIALGSAVAIIVGQQLGAGETEKARDTDAKLLFFSVTSCVVIGAILAALSPLIPRLYNTDAHVRALATQFLLVAACCMPIYGFTHCCYFTLRSGGRTGITFLFDSAFMWIINIPMAYLLAHYAPFGIVAVYLCCQLTDLIKCVIGFIMVKKGIWVNNIVAQA